MTFALALAHVAVVAICGLLAVVLGGPIVLQVFDRVDRSADEPPAHSLQQAGATLRGGSWVGMLERLAIFAGLFWHYPEAIAIAVAIKGLARYPELKATTSGAAERFIIGTFVSVMVAAASAGVALWLVGLF